MSFGSLAQRVLGGIRRRPELVAYAVTSAVTVIAGARENHSVQKVSKTAMMPALAVGVLKARDLPSHERALLLGGLTAAWVGDWILIDPDSDRNLLNGAKAFSVMQVAYTTLLTCRGARPSGAIAAQRFSALALGSGLLHAKARPVALPLTGYGALLGTTATLAADPALAPGAKLLGGMPLPDTNPATWTGLGGLIFTVSDGTIAVRRTLLTGKARQAAEAAILGTYAVAQYLLVEGMSRPRPA